MATYTPHGRTRSSPSTGRGLCAHEPGAGELAGVTEELEGEELGEGGAAGEGAGGGELVHVAGGGAEGAEERGGGGGQLRGRHPLRGRRCVAAPVLLRPLPAVAHAAAVAGHAPAAVQ